jgi:YidC/Oxa1 family membrane protein insertase
MWQAFVNLIGEGLIFFDQVISNLGIPYSFGFAIILFTLVIKVLTFPLNQQQIKSSKAQQALQPRLKELQKKYADNREELARAQMELYKEAGINPLGGCLPMLVQMPIWFGLYRALYDLTARPDTPLGDGFFWIPSLAGPVGHIGDNLAGTLNWLYPNDPAFVGWGAAIAYLVLPVLLVVSQIVTQKMMMPQSDDPQQRMMGQMMMFMPLMFGYFALVVPSGLSLYWFTSNMLSMAQQYWLTRDNPPNAKSTDKSIEISGQYKPKPSLEVSPATAGIENGTDTGEQVDANAKRKSKSRRKKRKKQR